MSRSNLSKVAFLMFGLVFIKFRKLKKLPPRKQVIPYTTELKLFSQYYSEFLIAVIRRFIVVFIPIIFAWGFFLFLKNNVSQMTKVKKNLFWGRPISLKFLKRTFDKKIKNNRLKQAPFA